MNIAQYRHSGHSGHTKTSSGFYAMLSLVPVGEQERLGLVRAGIVGQKPLRLGWEVAGDMDLKVEVAPKISQN